MNKILNKFLIGLLFILGVIIVPTYKVEAAITVILTASPPTVVYGGSSTISWTSTGATSCSESGGRGGTGTTGSFYVSSLSSNTTFNVTCSKPAYCSGTYVEEVDWNGNTWDGTILPSVLKNSAYFGWAYYNVYDGDGGGCGNCSQRGNLGYRVEGSNWTNPTCVKTGVIGCSGSRWSANAAIIRSAYVTKSCSDIPGSGSQGICTGICNWDWYSNKCVGSGGCSYQPTQQACFNYPLYSRSCTWNP
jgi:hypothetical protein